MIWENKHMMDAENLLTRKIAKEGDTVVCIVGNVSMPITLNRSYVVLGIVKAWSAVGIDIDKYYTLCNDDGEEGNYLIERFKTKAELRDKVIDEILKQ